MKFILTSIRDNKTGRGVFIIVPGTSKDPGSCIHVIENAVKTKGMTLSRFDRECLLAQIATIKALTNKSVDINRED